MPITRTPLVDDDGSGKTGTIINNAWQTRLYDQIDALGGPWTPIPFNAANFYAASGTWTVPPEFQVDYRFTVNSANRIVHVTYSFGASAVTLSAPTAQLFITIPGAPVPIAPALGVISYWISAGVGYGIGRISGEPVLNLLRDISGTPFAPQTGLMYLQGQLFYPY